MCLTWAFMHLTHIVLPLIILSFTNPKHLTPMCDTAPQQVSGMTMFSPERYRTFAKNLTVNVDYKRFNQVGEFNHDRSRNTNFAVGFEKAIGKTALRPILSIHTINILGKKMAAFNPTPIYY